jgi:hypothetical protein
MIAPSPNRGSFNAMLKNMDGANVAMRLIDPAGKTAWESAGTVHDNKLPVQVSVVPGSYIFEVSTETGVAGRQKVVIY